MNDIFQVFNLPWLHALGVTLLHSTWQSCTILAIVLLLFRLTPTKLSTGRYAVASFGLMAVPLLSIATFVYLYSAASLFPAMTQGTGNGQLYFPIAETTAATWTGYIDRLTLFIHSNIPLFLMIWTLGALMFCLRIITGLLYIGRIKDESLPIQGEGSNRIQQLAHRVGIQRFVTLAESALIHAPVVFGYLKPIILIPMGMCSHLSTQQLETIFLHELMHIRRNDYFLNVIQSFIEAIFFFNPFVWIISGLIRREREHCCDDAVVKLHGNVRDYAIALASLEEERLCKRGLSISLAENKNQLLNRIKRLMEKSVKGYSGRERVFPALLLIVGLICASWISIQTGPAGPSDDRSHMQTVMSDTTKRDKKQKKIKKNADAPKETLSQNDRTSNLENENNLKENDNPETVPPSPDAFHFEMPPMPDVAAMIPPILDIDIVAGDLDFPAMAWHSEKDWEEFGKEFEEKFKAKFGDFYQQNEDDIQRIIEEAQQEAGPKLDGDWGLKMQELARKHEQLARSYGEKWEEFHLKNAEEHAKQWVDNQAAHMKEFEKNHQEFERKMKSFEQNTKRFEQELKRELIKDGYIKENEDLTNIHWNNGSIEVNGKKIKTEHEKKYNALHQRFFEIH